jgi:activator of 2-hydroxyglutaryl-CoA dehydratase
LGITGVLERGMAKERLRCIDSLLATAGGARALHPRVRSIIEVGGQTTKFLVLDDHGNLRDFATNEAWTDGRSLHAQ